MGQSQFLTNVRTKKRFGSVVCRAKIDASQLTSPNISEY
jgi:hypothetical protein